MKSSTVLAASLLLSPSLSLAWILGPSNYEDCISDVIKNAKTELSVQLGVENCQNKFGNRENRIRDCSVTWNGIAFVKGSPETIGRYTEVGILNTTHRVFLPLDMKREAMEDIMKKNISQIKKFCPMKE